MKKNIINSLFGFRALGFLISFGFGILVLGFTAPAVAVPQYINYDGVLRDTAGNLQNGNFEMTFKIYSALTGGSAVSTTGPKTIAVASGIYSTTLDATAAIFDGSGKWLEVTVGSDVLSPRLKINSVAYAITADKAVTAETLSNYRAGVSGVGIVPTTDATTGKLSTSVIPTGITLDAVSGSLITSGTIAGTTAFNSSGNISTTGTITASATANTSPIITGLNAGAGVGVYGKSGTGTGVSAESTSGVALYINGKLGAATGTGKCAGTGTIIATNINAPTIANTAVTTSSIILLTVGHGASVAGSNTNAGIRVSTVTNGTSFVVSTMDGNAASTDIPFSYLIIN